MIMKIDQRSWINRIVPINNHVYYNNRKFLSKKSYTQTLNLPQCNFPMKHSRKLEINVEQQNVKFEHLFPRKKDEKCKQTFILHDGPPYANGDAHFGHAINRIFKDIIVKRKLLENYNVDFRPGWDCHGLPIEMKAIPNDSIDQLNALEIRDRARNLALNAIDKQRNAFKQFYLSANWSNIYRTIDLEYSINELNAFYQMYRNGLIFRDRMPVYWSPSTRTALAEAELQYKHDHISRAAFIRYQIIDHDFDALIWTTTPWTLLANEAIAFNNSMNYCLVKINDEQQQRPLLVAQENINVIKDLLKDYSINIIENESSIIINESIKNFHYKDPIDGIIKSFIPSTMVTSTKGTGLVHIAPDHGQEDFKLFRQYRTEQQQINKQSIVDDDGKLRISNYNNSLSIIDNNNEASIYVLNNILPKQSIVYQHDYQHNYPYDWRSSKPVIIKPSNQWFINIDRIRSKCLDALNQVNIYPELLRKEMLNQLSSRPNWCISRQRKYGVPIPVFFDKTDHQKPILNDTIYNCLMKKFIESNTLDVWWQQTPSQLLENYSSSSDIDPVNLKKSNDILDIWFDSGCSWLSVLGVNALSDIYLEGVDQLRGWFQSSLITSVALRGHAPYKSIIIHGFALDRNGHKMSKSLGNVIDPLDIVNGCGGGGGENTKISSKKFPTNCGVDGLRFWIARYACTHNDVHVDIKEFNDETLTIINRFRNTFRFILGYLTKYSPNDRSFLINIDNESSPLLDQYQLYLLLQFDQKCRQYYQQYRFGDLIESIIHYFNYKFSTFYLSRIKDRLYCNSTQSSDVLSIMTILHYVYHTVGFHMAPILPHLILECQQYLPFDHDAIINKKIIIDNNETSSSLLSKQFDLIQSIISCINDWAASNNRLIDLDCHLFIQSSHPDSREILKILQKFQPKSSNDHDRTDLIECLQVATVSYSIDQQQQQQFDDSNTIANLQLNDNNDQQHCLTIQLRKTKNRKCSRCRRFNIINNNSDNSDQLCVRCKFIMLNNN